MNNEINKLQRQIDSLAQQNLILQLQLQFLNLQSIIITDDESSSSAQYVEEVLIKNMIPYEREKSFESLPGHRFDFYLKQFDCIIEYQGQQHYQPVEYFGGKIGFVERAKKDYEKVKWCKDNNIHLIEIPYHHSKKQVEELIYKILSNIAQLKIYQFLDKEYDNRDLINQAIINGQNKSTITKTHYGLILKHNVLDSLNDINLNNNDNDINSNKNNIYNNSNLVLSEEIVYIDKLIEMTDKINNKYKLVVDDLYDKYLSIRKAYVKNNKFITKHEFAIILNQKLDHFELSEDLMLYGDKYSQVLINTNINNNQEHFKYYEDLMCMKFNREKMVDFIIYCTDLGIFENELINYTILKSIYMDWCEFHNYEIEFNSNDPKMFNKFIDINCHLFGYKRADFRKRFSTLSKINGWKINENILVKKDHYLAEKESQSQTIVLMKQN